jgi:hypothetical protein
MHKSATKCNETLSKWCKNKQGASKIIDTFETYQEASEGEADKGEGDEGEGDGSGGTLNLRNSGEVYICIFVMLLSIYIHAYINTLSSFSPPDQALLSYEQNEAQQKSWITL